MASRTRIAGHRGMGVSRVGGRWPENTIASLSQAARAGAEMVELDVQLSADGHAVVIHDDTVHRTTGGRGCVQAMTLAQLRRLDAGFGVRPGENLRIPTLEEVVAAVPLGLNVELKVHARTRCPAQDHRLLVERTLAALASVPEGRPVIVSSFDLEMLREARRTAPAARLGYLTKQAAGIAVAIDEGMAAAHIAHKLATRAHVQRLHEAGLEVNVWTVNDTERARKLLDLGVDMIITDEPVRLLALRDG